MKKLLPLAALCFAAASAAQAGEVFGTISENGKPLAAGATLLRAVAGAAIARLF